MISQRSIDEVLDVAVIEDVVGEYVNLKRSGTSRTGLCPFHEDTSPSFSVSPSKRIYKCFSCGKAGNVATFLMEHNQLTFFDAIRELAKRYNVELDETEVDQEEYDAAQRKRESLLIALDFASKYYMHGLGQEEGQLIGLTYLKERGLLMQTIKTFDLGYSKKGWDHFYTEAKSKGFSEEVLLEAGLIKEKEAGGYFDFFRERIIFPIKNSSGKTVAFAGRSLKTDDKGPKYLNSPETEVYHKSNVLYGLFEAKRKISQKDECLLVEGYLDVITLNQNGIEHVVASSGTALTKGQIKLVSRFTRQITVLFDGDAAGLNAAKKGIDIILEGGLDVKVVSLPDGEDPDSYCKQMGGEAFQSFIDEEKKDFIFFLAETFVDKAKGDPVQLVKYTRDILESLAKIPDSLKRSIYIQELAKIINQDEKVLVLELNKILWKGDAKKQRRTEQELEKLQTINAVEAGDSSPSDIQELEVLRLIVQSGVKPYSEELSVAQFLMQEVEQDEIEFANPFYKELFTEVIEKFNAKEELSDRFFLHHINPKVTSLAAGFIADSYMLSPLWSKNDIQLIDPKDNYVEDADKVILHLKRIKIHNDILLKQELLKEEDLSEEEVTSILKDLTTLKTIEQSIADVLGVVVLK